MPYFVRCSRMEVSCQCLGGLPGRNVVLVVGDMVSTVETHAETMKASISSRLCQLHQTESWSTGSSLQEAYEVHIDN